MAKLTDTQKAANKARAKLRDAAYRARRKEYDRALAEAEKTAESSPLFASMRQANEAAAASLRAADEEASEIHRKIAELQDQLGGLRLKHECDSLNRKRQEANSLYFKFKNEIEAAVNVNFKDMAGTYSAAAWEAGGHFKDPDA